MEFICNELSFYPLPADAKTFEMSFKDFFQAFDSAKSTYGFTHIRFPTNYLDQQVTTTETFGQWLYSTTNRILRELTITWLKKPYIDDLDDEDLDEYISNTFSILGDGCPTKISPTGLAIAGIKSLPTISIKTDAFWLAKSIRLLKVAADDSRNGQLDVCNFSDASDVSSVEMQIWSTELKLDDIDSLEILREFLNFSNLTISFSESFFEQLMTWKNSDNQKFTRTLVLMKDVELNPFVGGLGRTENLKGRGKEASKRITRDHRLSYSIENDVVHFIACSGHYEFHEDN